MHSHLAYFSPPTWAEWIRYNQSDERELDHTFLLSSGKLITNKIDVGNIFHLVRSEPAGKRKNYFFVGYAYAQSEHQKTQQGDPIIYSNRRFNFWHVRISKPVIFEQPLLINEFANKTFNSYIRSGDRLNRWSDKLQNGVVKFCNDYIVRYNDLRVNEEILEDDDDLENEDYADDSDGSFFDFPELSNTDTVPVETQGHSDDPLIVLTRRVVGSNMNLVEQRELLSALVNVYN